jgi:glycosyltransferase involved in cell wall biosynthesis
MRKDLAAFQKPGGTGLAPIGGVATTAPLDIAFVMTSFEPGGTERQMIELFRRLDRSRWRPHVACFQGHGAWYSTVTEAAASVAEFPVDSFLNPRTLHHMRAFARWCRQTHVSVVHTTELYSNIFGLPAAAMGRVPVRIGNRREINPDKRPAQIALQRAAYGCAHKVVANSQAAADRLMSERVPERKIAVVPNGLDVDQFSSRAARPSLRRVVVVANLRPEKGHDVLIDAAVEVVRRFPDARFELTGGGPELGVLQARAAASPVSHVFTFLGHRSDVAARLQANDIFVLPSRSEAFPNAVLEAMAAGLPIVASAVGGIPELVDNERTGLLVAPDDPRALAERICRLMTDPALAGRLGAAARADVEARYSFDRMVAAFESVYLTELARRGVVAAGQPELVAS